MILNGGGGVVVLVRVISALLWSITGSCGHWPQLTNDSPALLSLRHPLRVIDRHIDDYATKARMIT